jgi:hypothetical protein
MTEQKWLQAADTRPLLEYLRGRASQRKLRLFAVACCRRVERLLGDKRPRRAVEVAERYADGEATTKERANAREAARAFANDPAHYADPAWFPSSAAAHVCEHRAWSAAGNASWYAARYSGREDEDAERAAQADLLRDLFDSLPFRLVTLDLSWLTWHGGLLVSMARQMYESRDFVDMPVLADALEEAGCSDQKILSHCRQQGQVHVRGCWVIDLLLGKA